MAAGLAAGTAPPAPLAAVTLAPPEAGAPAAQGAQASVPGQSESRGRGPDGAAANAAVASARTAEGGPTRSEGLGAGAPSGGGGGRDAQGGGVARPPGTGGTPGSEYTPYLLLVRRHIQDALRYPLPARRRGLSGTVHVEILIELGGRITAASLVQSSSHALLDEAALEAVRSVPAVPFPAGIAPRPLRARLPVVFDLR